MKARSGSRVAVALSGGVDSAVAALLLKESGHEVVGVFLHLGTYGTAPSSGDSIRHEENARHVASRIGIDFVSLDLKSAFRTEIVDYFVSEYLSGRTPNPCARCNVRIKFKALLDRRQELGADRIATGHYARIETGPDRRLHLLAGSDRAKDQSYFLFAMTQQQLAATVFPIGPLTKEETRRIAENAGLGAEERAESQDICFLPAGGYQEFIRTRRPDALAGPGDIVDLEGNVLGRHDGLFSYTVGQRRGLGIASKSPLYVVRLDVSGNRVVVGSEPDLSAGGLVAGGVNWIVDPARIKGKKCLARIRYRHRGVPSMLEPMEGDRVRVVFDRPEPAVAPGQAAVFYDQDVVLGGGWIDEALPAETKA